MRDALDFLAQLIKRRLSERVAQELRDLFTNNPEIQRYLVEMWDLGFLDEEGVRQLATFLVGIEAPLISPESVKRALSLSIRLEDSNELAKTMLPEMSLLYLWGCRLVRDGYNRFRHEQLNLAALTVLAIIREERTKSAA